MTDTTDNRTQINYISVDSAPKRFAGPVSPWRGPWMLALFTGLAAAQLWLVNTEAAAHVFPNRDYVFSLHEGRHAIAIRVFMVSFYVAFAAFSSAGHKGRILFGLDLVLTFMAGCGIFDLANAAVHQMIGTSLSLHFSAIASGLFGFAVYSFKLLERGLMPARIRIKHVPVRQRRALVRLGCTLAVAAAVSVWVGGMELRTVELMRQWTLLGGIGPGVFLFLPVLFGQLYLLAIYDVLVARKVRFTPPVSVIVPAHNESYIIKATIEAMDRAAAHYGGDVHILIMNNNSTDDTEEIAATALAACTAAKGRVINVPKPGKSNALNAGLDACETEFLIRVDADTLVGEDNFSRALPYFSDPAVGVVGGVPVPPGGALFDKARHLEVLVKHGFYSVAMGAVNGVVGIPGMFVVYRTAHPRDLGGFVEGMNGEDTDISLRIGELGFHSVVDPRIRYISEVPSSYSHMREQRMRWFRSIYHISSRCRDLIYRPTGTLRGKIILPYMLINSARRAMLVPLIIYGALEWATGLNPESPIVWQSIVAVMVGAPALVGVVACVLNGVPRAILGMFDYLLFRILRAYFTLESMLSILVDTRAEDLERAIRLDLVPDKPIRVA
ncbi:glycosyltransferase family 2 protein [Tateyamaria omphalii]|uniref:glycosyltransferase n=1 Tax=Tateyamaria omphalii TaxID=299262 RepID=UPI001C996705|nr:glycosyltransferase [Tateyamaria omphalii]MBY5931711.1 glycosyltransferase family 2 protein [Tateyamaria omphalii]